MTDLSGAQREASAEPSKQNEEASVLGSLLVVFGGALLTGFIAAFALQLLSGSSNKSELTRVAASELDAAASTLVSSQATQRVADAKSCKAPLALLTVVKKTGSPDATIRIESGEYVSPPFVVTDVPQQLAVPYPAPYPVGRGVMSIIGEGKDITVWMTPGWTVQILSGTATHNVWWDPKPNC